MTGPVTSLTPAPTVTINAPTPFSAGFPSPPSFDPIELLPPVAAEKLRLLRQRSDDLHAVIPEGETVRQANVARVEAAAALSRLKNHPQDFGFNLPETDTRVIAAQRHLDKMTADAKRLQELQTLRTAAWQTASQAKAAVESWLRDGKPHGTTLEAVEVEPKLNKNEDVLSGIERLRRRVRELRADLHRIASASYPSSHAKAKMRQQIEALAMQGAPDVTNLIEHQDGEIIWPTRRMQVDIFNAQPGAVGFVELPDMLAMDAWRRKSELIAALDAEINAEADDPASLSHADRELRTADVMGDLLSVEFDESFFVWQAQAQSLPVEHRADISPLALLGLRLITTPRAGAAETTPGLSWPMRR